MTSLEMEDFLRAFDFRRQTSLYIHVPFCLSKCSYCAFYSVPGCTESLMDSYVERLLAELEVVNAQMKGRSFYTAFLGGGNPGCLGPERLERIAKAVCSNGRPTEFSVEMNPESLSPGFFNLFRDYFTRLSMGIQSMDPKALAFLGRNADSEKTLKGLELSQQLKSETGCDLSYDLITCLGSWHDETSDVRSLMESYPSDHLSVYALTLEEGTPLYRRNPELPDSDQQYDILKRVWNLLEQCGYQHYEVSNFARPGHHSKHNCIYWAYQQYVGLGPGAASTAFDENGYATRFNFRPKVQEYVNSSPFSGYDYEKLSRQESLEELVLMGLRYKGGLKLDRAFDLAGRRPCPKDLEALAQVPGFSVCEGALVPDSEGLMLADAAAETVLGILEK